MLDAVKKIEIETLGTDIKAIDAAIEAKRDKQARCMHRRIDWDNRRCMDCGICERELMFTGVLQSRRVWK